jgi:ribosome maturation factor RimP
MKRADTISKPNRHADAAVTATTAPKLSRPALVQHIEAVAETAARPAGIEIIEIELKGSGRHHLLRIYIDKPEGVTHADCELISREVGAVLDEEDPIPGSYELEVSSPGVERRLGKWSDWQRFSGRKVKIVLREPIEQLKHFEGAILRAENYSITIGLRDGREITFPFEQVERANLKFEW